MIAVESNILVYSHLPESPWFGIASKTIDDLWFGPDLWAIPWPCIHEFLSVATNPRIYNPSAPLSVAMAQVEEWLRSPSLRLLGEGPGYFERLAAVSAEGRVVGPRVHDARIAALCLYHGVSELLTADRDFGRFPSLKTRNPLVG